MFLVLCNAGDVACLWAYLQLQRELGEAIELVTAEALVNALRWEHRITSDVVATTITLADGRVLRSENIRATLNRITHLPPPSVRAAVADREYAAAELRAFFASWIHALPGRVWNPACPAGLSGGSWRRSAEWTLLAHRSGFAVEPASAIAPGRMMLVIGERVVGDPSLERHAIGLSRASDTPILGITVGHDGTFHSATPHPDLRLGGAAAIASLREQLFAEAH